MDTKKPERKLDDCGWVMEQVLESYTDEYIGSKWYREDFGNSYYLQTGSMKFRLKFEKVLD